MGSGSAKIGGFILLLLVGWVFVLGSNKFHVTAASVIVCLSYLAILFTVWNLWRTGASAAGPVEEDEGWSRPIGARGELEKEKKTLLKGIKEAEFDAAMGKLSKADADSLIREYRGRAIEVIKQIEGLGGVGLSTREQIEHEVKARIALDLSDKPSNRAKKVVNARAAAAAKSNGVKAKATEKDVASVENADAKSDEERPALPAEISAEAKAKASAEADAIAAKAQAAASPALPGGAAPPNGGADKVALAEAKAAAAQAAAEAAEAKAEAARAMAEAAEAKAEAVKAAAETNGEGERA
jgi:colicin import membrane protein